MSVKNVLRGRDKKIYIKGNLLARMWGKVQKM